MAINYYSIFLSAEKRKGKRVERARERKERVDVGEGIIQTAKSHPSIPDFWYKSIASDSFLSIY